MKMYLLIIASVFLAACGSSHWVKNATDASVSFGVDDKTQEIPAGECFEVDDAWYGTDWPIKVDEAEAKEPNHYTWNGTEFGDVPEGEVDDFVKACKTEPQTPVDGPAATPADPDPTETTADDPVATPADEPAATPAEPAATPSPTSGASQDPTASCETDMVENYSCQKDGNTTLYVSLIKYKVGDGCTVESRLDQFQPTQDTLCTGTVQNCTNAKDGLIKHQKDNDATC